MNIKPLHSNFQVPTRATDLSGGFDIYMPESGSVFDEAKKIPLGFAAEVPPGHVALLLPRSGVGSKFGLELNNTCGVIDADYRGEWLATLRTKDGSIFSWNAGERLLQLVIVPVLTPELTIVDELSSTERGEGGLGHSGK